MRDHFGAQECAEKGMDVRSQLGYHKTRKGGETEDKRLQDKTPQKEATDTVSELDRQVKELADRIAGSKPTNKWPEKFQDMNKKLLELKAEVKKGGLKIRCA